MSTIQALEAALAAVEARVEALQALHIMTIEGRDTRNAAFGSLAVDRRDLETKLDLARIAAAIV